MHHIILVIGFDAFDVPTELICTVHFNHPHSLEAQRFRRKSQAISIIASRVIINPCEEWRDHLFPERHPAKAQRDK